ncbi:hypothetical protein ETD86_35260 [Nonomuraea turkmeniaca]|uniref:Trypsin-co-occurring domain-containing protein n=1 Tax=Nonomuraea turkmeniaca TaxID=103838 RepID=A0A5S4F662_9ACTN|nr:CU044_2847 family protein [Nonomuraea turkmeniaca]TMR11614.1 hypothetical protein ETD86_35260 [Nonomuraea turkmeniaca]
MAEYVEVRLSDGESIPFEVEETDAPVPAGRRWQATTERAQETLEQSVDRIVRVARAVARRAEASADRAEKVTVEVGLTVTADVGAVIAKTTSAAHIKISIERQSERPGLGNAEPSASV